MNTTEVLTPEGSRLVSKLTDCVQSQIHEVLALAASEEGMIRPNNVMEMTADLYEHEHAWYVYEHFDLYFTPMGTRIANSKMSTTNFAFIIMALGRGRQVEVSE
tara:strand:+ start:1511 stop:1822 length:312 start_codon:yes stop_codon:yes gene_type:complete